MASGSGYPARMTVLGLGKDSRQTLTHEADDASLAVVVVIDDLAVY
jgi:hypothetical protein